MMVEFELFPTNARKGTELLFSRKILTKKIQIESLGLVVHATDLRHSRS